MEMYSQEACLKETLVATHEFLDCFEAYAATPSPPVLMRKYVSKYTCRHITYVSVCEETLVATHEFRDCLEVYAATPSPLVFMCKCIETCIYRRITYVSVSEETVVATHHFLDCFESTRLPPPPCIDVQINMYRHITFVKKTLVATHEFHS